MVEHTKEPRPDALPQHVRDLIPRLSALYRLSPAAQQTDAHVLPLGIIYDGDRLAPLERWNAEQRLGELLGNPVEFADLCELPLPKQLQLMGSATRLWARDVSADLYELSLRQERAKATLQRAHLLSEITGAMEAARGDRR